jgi:hypothetical protein
VESTTATRPLEPPPVDAPGDDEFFPEEPQVIEDTWEEAPADENEIPPNAPPDAPVSDDFGEQVPGG